MTVPIRLAEEAIELLNEVEQRLTLDPSNNPLQRAKEILFYLLDEIGAMEHEGVKEDKVKMIEERLKAVREALWGKREAVQSEAGRSSKSEEGKESEG